MIRGSALLLLAAAAWAQNPSLRPAAGRAIVLVVDDLRLPPPTLLRVRQALNGFVAQHLRPDDTVAVLRTGAGVGAMEGFSSDKPLIEAAIAEVKFSGVDAAAQAGRPRNEVFSYGTLGALRYAVNGLREVAGRKTVILLSGDVPPIAQGVVQQLGEAALRAFATIYCIDLGARPDGAGGGLAELARAGGGSLFMGVGDIGGAVRKALDDFASHGDGAGRVSPAEQPPASTPDARLARALRTPFDTGAVHVRLTALYTDEFRLGSMIVAILHIDAADLQFRHDPEGWRAAVFDLQVATCDEQGNPVDTASHTYILRIREDDFRETMEKGVIWENRLPVKKPGAYQVRTVLRDAGTGHLGSASQFLVVPDLTKGQLTLSSLVLNQEPSDSAPPFPGFNEDQMPAERPSATLAVRRFERGANLIFTLLILNAQIESGRRSVIQVEFRLLRDGQPVYTGRPGRLAVEQDPGRKRAVARGELRLGSALQPGDYVLQVNVTDGGSTNAERMATQWTDFGLVR